jgi:hypothetical protein
LLSDLKEVRYESDDSWNGRMQNLVGVFAAIAMETSTKHLPAGSHSFFSLELVYSYLLQLTNYLAVYSHETNASNNYSTIIKQLEYVLMIYEVLLKITAKELHAKYGQEFMNLCHTIQTLIFDKIFKDTKSMRKDLLGIFFDQYIASNGQKIVDFFVSTKR